PFGIMPVLDAERGGFAAPRPWPGAGTGVRRESQVVGVLAGFPVGDPAPEPFELVALVVQEGSLGDLAGSYP
ncbi:MAG TPA: hypothetical protein VFD73_14545, partial [Gemmatimonadales bacterium]|nr:hypothetical protein [Gemmatimonadales bacterium]